MQSEIYSHKWDRDGERCVYCGQKDWMSGEHCHLRPKTAHIPLKLKYTDLLSLLSALRIAQRAGTMGEPHFKQLEMSIEDVIDNRREIRACWQTEGE